MRVSIKDIARAAGVSHSTVSRALNDSALVNESTKRHIQALANQMGYCPNTLARSLVTRHSNTIGVVVTTITDPFMAEVVQGIQVVADEHKYTVILCSSEEDVQRELAAVEMLYSKRVDGVICVASRVGALYADHQERIGVPVVIINNHNEQVSRYPFTVSVDNVQGGYLAARHLVRDGGHQRIAYVSGPRASTHSSSQDRLNGYGQALYEANLESCPELILTGNGCPEGGEGALEVLLGLPEPPTAVFCYNDMTAMGLMDAARRRGVAVPADLAVVGFDNILLSAYLNPSLTTISQPKMEMGRRAMAMALSLIQRGDWTATWPGEKTELAVQCDLVVRESSLGYHGRSHPKEGKSI